MYAVQYAIILHFSVLNLDVAKPHRNVPDVGFILWYCALQLMETGTMARTVASTNMNATSSRAHTVFQIILTQTKVDRALGKATDKVGLPCVCGGECTFVAPGFVSGR